MSPTTEYKSLFKYLDDHHISYQTIIMKEISPYPFIKCDESNLIIHLISPQIENAEWHSSASPLQNINNYFSTYKVIHLWNDTFVLKTEACLSRISASFGLSKVIYGRKVSVKKINKPDLDQFLEKNHTGRITNARIKYGLFLKDELVGVASFSGKRKMTKTNIGHESYELIRYCNKNGYTIMGGLGKILKQFVSDYSPDDIMTYTESDWSNGESFSNLGFKKSMNNHSVNFIWKEKLKTRELIPYNQTISDLKKDEMIFYTLGSIKYIFNFNSINV
ncbi:hypothetical protein [Flammeovirga pacifica]|uniref:Uncharacterized protein n=1 Tax=Flammeovirga pacifica TaxID=915059 RepID=A0A1S1YYS4_FLAPC|nr:hypothetical protein [Flammeovirga pacifica]OHX66025.1 hypothetical protein NH26_06490 [Flammeovirga pacifica]